VATRLVVIKPVVDLRKTPDAVLPDDYSHQDERETQLLFGETVTLIEEKKEWLKIGALEQLRFSQEQGWHPYPGWIHVSDVQEASTTSPTYVMSKFGTYSYGTLLPSQLDGTRLIPKSPNRAQIVAEARHFMGAPYLWGGRSSPTSHTISSVDCSGLIHLLYRAQGIHLPRDAHDQYLVSQPTINLQPADLLFLAKNTRINHVIMKLDENTFIEAPETGKTVRTLTWGTEIWTEEDKIKIFDRPLPFKAYPRSFLRLSN
jgi:gamma-D-glutamyl-L-lysine dipeptidyl-peptidase